MLRARGKKKNTKRKQIIQYNAFQNYDGIQYQQGFHGNSKRL